MKKIISIVLLVIMFFSILVSCSGEQIKLMNFLNSGEDELTFDGITWTFGKVQDYFMDSDAIMGYVENTGFSDAARQRVKDVEDRFDISYKEITVDRVNDEVLLDSVSGISRFYAVQDESFFLVDGIRAGLYTDLTELSDYIDYRDSYKWGGRNVLESLCWNGGLYAVVPMAMPLLSYSSACNVIVANLDYITAIGMPNPRTYYENNEWTWDKLKEILPLYTQQSDNPDNYKYGLLCGSGWFARGMIYSNCKSSVVMDANGKYVPVTSTDAGLKALQESWDICFGELGYTIDREHSCLDYEEIFPNGNHALVDIDAYQVYSTTKSLAYTMPNIAILPFPTGPDIEAGSIPSSSSSLDYSTAIPKIVDDPHVSAIIIDALYTPFEGYETEESLIEYMTDNYFSNEEDSRIFIEIAKNMLYEYSDIGYSGYAYDSIEEDQSVTEFISSNMGTAQSLIDEYIVNHITSADEIFG